MTIDIFSTPQGSATDFTSADGGAISSMAGPQPGSILPPGGTRELFVEKTNGAIGLARLEIGFDALFYSSSSGISGRFEIAWLNLDGVDLTFGDSFTLVGEIDDAAAVGPGTLLGLVVEDASGNFARDDVLLTASGPFQHAFAKSDFTGVDFSQIERIRLGNIDAASGNYVDVPSGGDVTVNSLELTVVPEPASFLLPMIAIIGMAMLARRRIFRGRPSTR